MLEGLRKFVEEKVKKYSYISSDVPTTEELEALKQARERVFLVIKMRWMILAIFLIYGLYAGFFLRFESKYEIGKIHKTVPVVAFLFAVAYNAWYHYSYRWFSRIRHLNLIQILFDMAVVTVIVHFSGGAVSWFWAMYFVLILEGAFLGEKSYDAVVIAVLSSLSYGALLTAEYYGWIPAVKMPYENNALQQTFSYEMLKWMWVTVIALLVGGIGSYMMGEIREKEDQLRKMIITDSLTGLYNRWYFYLRLNSEIQRAKRYGRTFSLLVLDVDDFKKFNDTYGHQTGDLLLQSVANVIKKNVRRNDTYPKYDVDIPCRVGGEEFAVILPEASSVQSSVAAERLRMSVETKGAALVAERIRKGVEAEGVDGKRVTVSIGVASFPEHGTDADALFRAADDAMYLAKKRGKNRVVVAPATLVGGERR
ncbi:MAG: GGDEF domain-containing protein [Deltaproteobacteria bacterium]|nr:MAG: GGDEF domain-containing protein [Deltaproteobacteria bacterium]